MNISHADCIQLLANPSTQKILEALGFEYSDRGLAEYRKVWPDVMPALTRAIVAELEICPTFPPEYRDGLPHCGVCIQKRGGDFLLLDIDKPSVWTEYAFSTPQGAARGYIRKVVDSYWLRGDAGGDVAAKSVSHSWLASKTST